MGSAKAGGLGEHRDYTKKLEKYRLILILMLSAAFFVAELVLSHISNSLTLLMDSYHSLCNVIALIGCLVTIVYSNDKSGGLNGGTGCSGGNSRRIINTFGWTRINILVMLICLVLNASFCFSIVVDAVQNLIHLAHSDAMTRPLDVALVGLFGLVLNFLCYLLIGGFAYRQDDYLHTNKECDPSLCRMLSDDGKPAATDLEASPESLQDSRSHRKKAAQSREQCSHRQGLWPILRDSLGCLIVVASGTTSFFSTELVAKLADPIFAILSAIMLMALSYPYAKELSKILLQTIPRSINIELLHSNIMKSFPQIVNLHDFHIWELTKNNLVSTVHVVFENLNVYASIKDDLTELFTDHGISHVTIQPEFLHDSRLLLLPLPGEKEDQRPLGDDAKVATTVKIDGADRPESADQQRHLFAQYQHCTLSCVHDRCRDCLCCPEANSTRDEQPERTNVLAEANSRNSDLV